MCLHSRVDKVISRRRNFVDCETAISAFKISLLTAHENALTIIYSKYILILLPSRLPYYNIQTLSFYKKGPITRYCGKNYRLP